MINVFILDAGDNGMKDIARSLRLSRQKSITLWIGRAWVEVPPYNIWKDKHVIDEKVGQLANQYFEWKIDEQNAQVLSHELRCMWWRMKTQNQAFCILTSQRHAKNRKVMFEDSSDDASYPRGFESIRCFNNYDDLMNYCRALGEVKFSLHDTSFFKHERGIIPYKGAEVYRELATGRLWYRDTLHKDHYEVFEPFGKNHIAVADKNGVIDFTKADSDKRPIA